MKIHKNQYVFIFKTKEITISIKHFLNRNE